MHRKHITLCWFPNVIFIYLQVVFFFPCGVFIRYLLCWAIRRAGPTADRLALLTLLKMTYQITQRTGICPCLWFFKYHPTFWEHAAHNSVKITRQSLLLGGGGVMMLGRIYQLPVTWCTRNTQDKHLICPRQASVYPSITRAKAKRKVTCAECKYRLAAFLYPQSQSQQSWTTSKPCSVSAQPGQHSLPCVGVRCPRWHNANPPLSAEHGWHSRWKLRVCPVLCCVCSRASWSQSHKYADHGSAPGRVCVRGDCAHFQVVQGRTYFGVWKRKWPLRPWRSSLGRFLRPVNGGSHVGLWFISSVAVGGFHKTWVAAANCWLLRPLLETRCLFVIFRNN